MTVASVWFLGFLLAAVLVFYMTPIRYRWLVLLAASLVFYLLAGGAEAMPFILLTSLVTWYGARCIDREHASLAASLAAEGLDRQAKKALRERTRVKNRRILLACLFVSVGILCATKFVRMAAAWTARVAATADGRWDIAWLIVPLGISYYTFSTVGYLLDVYWKRYPHEESFVRFFLYAIYFPHILQGPISRYNLLGQELKKELRYDGDRLVAGIQLMLWGFFKKLVIADRLNLFVTNAYNGEFHSGSMFLVAILFDALMIYTDFSGYMDIVRGASQLFGVELEQNFNHPFFSESVPGFWRRWHMSLGGWFRDYVYYPITVSKWMKRLNKWAKNALPERASRVLAVAVPCLITWFLTGLWHGTGLPYVSWGIYYGVLITCSMAFEPEFAALSRRLAIDTDSRLFRWFRMARTFCVFMGGRLLTSPGSLAYTRYVIRCITGHLQIWQLFDGTIFTFGIDQDNMELLVVSLFLLWAVSMLQEHCSIREKLAKQPLLLRWGLTYAGIFAVLIFGIYGPGYNAASFIYTQF